MCLQSASQTCNSAVCLQSASDTCSSAVCLQSASHTCNSAVCLQSASQTCNSTVCLQSASHTCNSAVRLQSASHTCKLCVIWRTFSAKYSLFLEIGWFPYSQPLPSPRVEHQPVCERVTSTRGESGESRMYRQQSTKSNHRLESQGRHR